MVNILFYLQGKQKIKIYIQTYNRKDYFYLKPNNLLYFSHHAFMSILNLCLSKLVGHVIPRLPILRD